MTDFVLDKVIFSNVFEKDIRRIYIYRKSERLAKAIQLITPAFGNAPSLRNRLDGIAVGLIDAAILPPSLAREALSRELLALSSLLSVARTGGFLSDMNADLISREAHLLLQEIAGYEEPRLFLEDLPTLAEFAKNAPSLHGPISSPEKTMPTYQRNRESIKRVLSGEVSSSARVAKDKGQLSDSPTQSSRQEAILTILRSKGPSYIKDISTVIRDVSEKTVQPELQTLVAQGQVKREGERRWTQYFIS